MKRIGLFALLLCLTGCARFTVTLQETRSAEDVNTITTEVKAVAWFSSAQHLTDVTTSLTAATQKTGAKSVDQQGSTNMVAILEAIGRIAAAAAKP